MKNKKVLSRKKLLSQTNHHHLLIYKQLMTAFKTKKLTSKKNANFHYSPSGN